MSGGATTLLLSSDLSSDGTGPVVAGRETGTVVTKRRKTDVVTGRCERRPIEDVLWTECCSTYLGTCTHAYSTTATTTATSTDIADINTAKSTDSVAKQHQKHVDAPRPPIDYAAIQHPVLTFGKRGNGAGQFHHPRGIAVSSSDGQCLFVADCSGRRIQQLGFDGTYIKSVPIEGIASGLAVAADGHVWACFQDDGAVVLLHKDTGSSLRSIRCPGAWGVTTCTSPAGDSLVLVSTGDRGGVVCFTAEGAQRWSSTDRNLGKTCGIAVVPQDNLVVVCDSQNSCLQVLSLSTGHFVRAIAHQFDLGDPLSVVYDPVSHLLIAGETGCVSVWTIDGQLVHQWARGIVDHAFGVAINPSNGQLAVCDYCHHRLVIF